MKMNLSKQRYHIEGSISQIDLDLYYFTWSYDNDCKDVRMSRSELVEFIANLHDFSECFVISIEGKWIDHGLLSSMKQLEFGYQTCSNVGILNTMRNLPIF